MGPLFFGSPAVRHSLNLTRGFASPPRDGFAFVGKRSFCSVV